MGKLYAIWAASCLLLGTAVAAQAADPFAARVADVRGQIMVDPRAALAQTDALRAAADRSDGTRSARTARAASVDWLRAEALIALNRPQDALRLLATTLPRVAASGGQPKLQAELTMARAGAAGMLGRVQDSLRDNQAAFRLFGLAGDQRGQAVALQNIGTIYYEARDYPNALRYGRQSIERYSGDRLLLLAARNNLGNAYLDWGRHREAEAEYQRALDAARRLGSPVLTVRILQNLARAQAEAGRLDAADATLATAFRIAATGPAASWRPALDGVAAVVALKRDRIDQATRHIDRALAAADATQAALPLRDFHHAAYEIYRRSGRPEEALVQLEAFKRLDDEARSLAASTSAALMGARFDFANQNLRIAELRAGQAERDATIARAEIRFRNALMTGLLSAAALVSLLLAIGFVSIRRSRNQVRAANATLTETNVALEKALAAKTEFFATTSHEIRTPLNGILGMTQVILADRQLDPTLRSRIELLHGSGETMRALVDDILDMAKIETGELRVHPAEMDLRRLLEETAQVWTGQAETKRIAIQLDLGDVPARIVADEVRLRQIVFNLISNAVKFTDRGHVRLSAAVDGEGEDETLRIAVEDTGLGIPAERLEDIFDSFSQVDGGTARRHGGTGLGLAICRNLARAMGGDVTATSILGTGSTFTLAIPLVRGAVAAGPGQRPPVERLADVEMLVVDSNPLAQGVLRAMLGGQTAGLSFVANLEAAVHHLETQGADHVLADGVALGLDPDAARSLADAARDVGARMTLLWPAPSAADRDALTTRGVVHLLAKPIPASELVPALRMLYESPAAGRGMAA
jgi:signal transduction histidine kinase